MISHSSPSNVTPTSRSMFKRIANDSKISDNQKQIWRRINMESPLNQYKTIVAEKTQRMPSLKKEPVSTRISVVKTER